MKRERYSEDLNLFLDEVIYPALFDRLPSAFPFFGWRKSGSAWVATSWPADFPEPVEDPRPDRLMVYPDRPHWVKVHGHAGVRFLDLVNGGRKPTGPEFLPAVRSLCDLAGVPFPEREVSAEEVERRQKVEARRSALEVVTEYAQETLFSPAGKDALSFLTKERGFTVDEARGLGLGFYDSVAKVRKALEAAGVDLQAAEDAGLLWPKLEGYVLIPWADAMGHPLTLYGRWSTKTPPEGRPKTLALPGEGTKSSPLYFDRARRAGHRDLVAVEGVFDAALLQARGDSRVVAYVAAQFSGGQVETMTRHRVRSVVVCPDPDGGGDRGAHSSVDALTKAGIDARVTPRLPDGLDPDEFLLRDGLEGWKAHVQAAVSGTVYQARVAIGNVTPDSPEVDRRQAVYATLSLVGSLRGPRAGLDREDVLRLTAEATGYTYEALEELAEDHATLRRKEETERTLDRLVRDAQAGRAEGADALQVARQLTDGLSRLHAVVEEPPPWFSVDRLERESRELPEGKPSGWGPLDTLDVRFNPGELALLAARTGHGKTSVLVNLLRNWLRETEGTDEAFVFYSAEEPETRIFHRLLALESVDLTRGEGWFPNTVRDYLRSPGSLSFVPDPRLLEAARERVRSWEGRFLVVNRPGWDAEKLAAHARTVAGEKNLAGVFVDYLQRIPAPPGSHDRRDIEVSAVGRTFNALSIDASCPVVVGAQMNRDSLPKNYSEDLRGKSYPEATVVIRGSRPELHHLREGGSEQEADLVLGLLNYAADYRTEAKATGEKAAPETTLFEVGILKNRYGEVGRWAGLVFEGRFNLIREPHSHEDGDLQVETLRPWREQSGEVREENRAARLAAENERTERERLRLQTAEARARTEEARTERKKLSSKPKKPPTGPEAKA